jgi:hypothetical protein
VFSRVISRIIDLFQQIFFFSLEKHSDPYFLVRCLPCWWVKEGRGRLNAWCERSRGVFVVLEVSTCGEDKGGYGHVCNVWGDMLFFGVPCVSPLSFHFFGFLVPKLIV